MIHVEILARDLESVRKALGLPKRFLTPHLVCIGLNATAAEASKTGKNRYLVAILPPRTAFRALPCDHPDLATKPMIVMVAPALTRKICCVLLPLIATPL